MLLLAIPFGLAIGLIVGAVGGGGAILALPVLVYVLGEGRRARLDRVADRDRAGRGGRRRRARPPRPGVLAPGAAVRSPRRRGVTGRCAAEPGGQRPRADPLVRPDHAGGRGRDLAALGRRARGDRRGLPARARRRGRRRRARGRHAHRLLRRRRRLHDRAGARARARPRLPPRGRHVARDHHAHRHRRPHDPPPDRRAAALRASPPRSRARRSSARCSAPRSPTGSLRSSSPAGSL